ncbi:serine/threonine protein kinase [Streptomyces sp. MH191]|uniref:serine/threonine protein kinase n=2 Tax=unclassified Streptomyces TaxID=2593676 RepID=UPI001F36812C|nr:serine/threonine protein kinase [Streptomyces sp. MH191]
MAMGHERVSVRELVAGRYRAGETVHREEGRLLLRGEDTGSGREVLLVRSRPSAHPRADTPPRTAERVVRETARMEDACPGRIAHVLDVVEEYGGHGEYGGGAEGGGPLWTVLRPVEGVPLGELLGRGALSPARAAHIGLALLDVLRAAHRQGIVHGDLSPGQVFVGADGGVVLTGFGLLGSAPGRRVTAPEYASPEQAHGECAGTPSDLWSLGALLYAMAEGRPPFRDRGEAAATLRGVARLPLRPPSHAGPLAPAVTGLLRRDPQERVPEEAVRKSLTRLLRASPAADAHFGAGPAPAEEPPGEGPRAGGGRPLRLAVLLGTALAVAACSLAVYATRGGSGGEGTVVSRSAPTASRPAAVVPGGAGETERTSSTAPSAPPASSTPSSPATTAAPSSSRPPAGTAERFARQHAPEGFSLDLPAGWHRVFEDRRTDGSYRVAFGAQGDPRTLLVTHSLRLEADPVADWAALEPALRRSYPGYRRLGAITPVTYRGLRGADMRWLARDGGVSTRTLGRGFLLDGRSGYSLRWTAPAAAFDQAVNRRALDRVLRTFRFPDG